MNSVKDIKPKIKNVSDKFSANLFEYCRRNASRFLGGLPCVYYNCTQTRWDKEKDETVKVYVPFDKLNFNLAEIWLGSKENDNWYHGTPLRAIIGDSRERYTVFANPWWRNNEVLDITDWFWKEYIRVGRCIWDRNHNGWLRNDDNRFTYVNKNSRKCNWCGKWQHREIKKKVSITRKEFWISETEKG